MIIRAINGDPVSRINLDEWGNLGPMTQGSRSEINYTGKKMDPNTGLFYFNQRYYDPELGRFITHDPAEQGLNPYAYSGNSPLMYVDPDGEWFFALIAAALMEGAKAAVINTGAQWALNGFDSRNINWNSVGNSFSSGSLGTLVGGIAGINLGDGFFQELGTAAINRGIGNVTTAMVSGQHMSVENTMNQFASGAQQGLGDFLLARVISGAQLSVGKEYTETYESLKKMVEELSPGEGFIVASGGILEMFEHWQVMYNENGVAKNFGALASQYAEFGSWQAIKGKDDYADSIISNQRKLRIEKVLGNVDSNASRRYIANPGYNVLLNNCVHAVGKQR